MREASCHVDRAYLVYREGFIAMEITIKWQDESVPLLFYRKIAGTKKLKKFYHNLYVAMCLTRLSSLAK